MKKIYKLEYKNIIGQDCERIIPVKDIISAMNWAKEYCFVNRIIVGWVVTPSNKRYIV